MNRKQRRRKARKVSNNLPTKKLILEKPETSSRVKFTAVPQYDPQHPKSLVPRSPSGGLSNYRFTFALTIPGNEYFNEDLDLNKITSNGHSLLVADRKTSLKVDISNSAEAVTVFFHPNSKGEISIANIEVVADSFEDAEKKANDLLWPILSRWSFEFDISVDVASYKVEEEVTNSLRFFVGIQGRKKPVTFQSRMLSKPEHRDLYAAYREGMNSTNVFYKFLCFYKITEGIKTLKTSLTNEALREGKATPKGDPERIPNNFTDLPKNEYKSEYRREIFEPYLGWKFNKVLDDFRETIRNAMAHIDPSKSILSYDKYEDVKNCENKLPVLKYIARQMLQNLVDIE